MYNLISTNCVLHLLFALTFRWTEDELSSLSWYFMQSCGSSDLVTEIIKNFKEDGILKPKDSVIKELFKQNLINDETFERLMKGETDKCAEANQIQKVTRDEEIGKLCEQLLNDGKRKFLDWVQKVLLDTCYAKIYLEKKNKEAIYNESRTNINDSKLLNFDMFKKKSNDLPIMSPVSYHSLRKYL